MYYYAFSKKNLGKTSSALAENVEFSLPEIFSVIYCDQQH